ncbi:MAG: NADH-quinone oxidoreductase subunit C [Acidobacteria bacterium]|nr:NADH-quinone oxidoreductase subunit C [Acidobacteriota bacterium]
MADEQKPGGPVSPSPGEGAPKPAPPKPAPAAPKPPAVMAAVPWESDLSKALKERFGDSISECSTYLNQNFVAAKPEAVIPIIEYLKLEAVDITAVDWPKRPARFDVIYILYSFARNERVRVKTAIPDGAKMASAVPLHLAANWLEREVYDMFGIEFEGHPDLRRILLPDEWQGHPLRKEYSILQQDEKWVQENLGIESGQ